MRRQRGVFLLGECPGKGQTITDVVGPRIVVRPVGPIPLLYVDEPELTGPNRVAKALFDRLAAVVALVLVGPFILGLALAVRLTSRGPAFYRQDRVGLDGRAFAIVKLRTMAVIEEVEDSPRGVYSGAFGWLAADGRADLGVVIRTLTTTGDGRYRLGTGGGITVQSSVEDEYAESRWKAERLLRALDGDTVEG